MLLQLLHLSTEKDGCKESRIHHPYGLLHHLHMHVVFPFFWEVVQLERNQDRGRAQTPI
ncbi:hypothetical protein Hanom_Chr09g00847391 [Helianthus anomalus]